MDVGDYIVVSVMGPHAGESNDEIFTRKKSDINQVGRTFWLVRSLRAKPPRVQSFCEEAKLAGQSVTCLFLEPAQRGGARPAESSDEAREFSRNNKEWESLPSGLGPVTGRIDRGAYAIVLDKLELLKGPQIDLGDLTEHGLVDTPIRFRLGASTTCAVRSSTQTHPLRMKSAHRAIIATGRLAAPYSVWLR